MKSLFSLSLVLASGMAILACSPNNFDLTPQSQSFAEKVKYNRQADVLFVMEASGAMDQQQRYQAVAAQIPNLVKVLLATKLDFHIAVTSMTPRFQDPSTQSLIGDGGLFHSEDSNPAVLTSTMTNLSDILSSRLTFKSSDFLSSMNFGRLAVQNALSDPLDTLGDAGFLRPQAMLNIIFISSKEDDMNNQTPVDLATFLDGKVPPLATGERSWYAHYVGVLSNAVTDQCASGQWNYRSAGTKFMSLVTASGGTATSICNNDLTAAASTIQARILEVVTQYHLASAPNVSTIQVLENGVVVAQDSTNGWTYDATSQDVVFHGTAIPADGTPFQVNFTPAGIQ